MAKIYEFPTEKTLPANLQGYLQGIAETYIYVLLQASEYYYGKKCTDEQFREVSELVSDGYAKELGAIIDKLEGP